MTPTPNIYASLLKGTSLSYGQAIIWEARMKTCHRYTKFGRRYRQKMRFLLAKEADEYTLFSNSYEREYYKLPQWERDDGDNDPVEPHATETYKHNVTFDNNDWSSSDEEGTILGYDSTGDILFCQDQMSGKHVGSNQMVVPGLPSGKNIKFIAKFADQRNDQGRIECNFDPIKKRYYDADLDDDDDPYLTLMIQRRCERNKRRQMLEEGEQLEMCLIKQYI
jgi:hypothetical protein